MTKDIYWNGTSGDKVTVTYSGTAGTGLPVSVSSDRNTGNSDRTKTLTFSTTPSGASVSVLVTQAKPVELRTAQYGLNIPASCTYLGVTVTTAGTAVSMNIPAESPSGTTIQVTRLTMVADGNHWYIAASTYGPGTFYMVNGGQSGYYMVSDIRRADMVTDFTCSWIAGDRIFNRINSTATPTGTYILNSSRTQLVFESSPSTDNLYRDITAGKLYEYNGSTLVEIT